MLCTGDPAVLFVCPDPLDSDLQPDLPRFVGSACLACFSTTIELNILATGSQSWAFGVFFFTEALASKWDNNMYNISFQGQKYTKFAKNNICESVSERA